MKVSVGLKKKLLGIVVSFDLYLEAFKSSSFSQIIKERPSVSFKGLKQTNLFCTRHSLSRTLFPSLFLQREIQSCKTKAKILQTTAAASSFYFPPPSSNSLAPFSSFFRVISDCCTLKGFFICPPPSQRAQLLAIHLGRWQVTKTSHKLEAIFFFPLPRGLQYKNLLTHDQTGIHT